MTFDLRDFTLRDRLTCLVGMMRETEGASTMADAAGIVVRFLQAQAHALPDGQAACPAVLAYRTATFADLPAGWQDAWTMSEGAGSPGPSGRFSVLLAEAGESGACEDLQWHPGGRISPVSGTHLIEHQPLLAHLYHRLGLDLGAPAAFQSEVEHSPASKPYSVLLVGDAQASRYTLPIREHVDRLGIRSILAFGGRLTNGDAVGTLVYSRVRIRADSAEQFRAIAMDTTALFRTHEGQAFSRGHSHD